MKKLIIMRGLPCSGKSSWVKDKGYESFTLSMDSIRLMFKEPSPYISQEYNRRVAEMFNEMLEARMKNGSFTVIDNVNQTWAYIKPYLQLAEDYDYDWEIMDFSDVLLEDCIERNKLRDEYKFVPEDIIRRMHRQMKDSDKCISDAQDKYNKREPKGL